MVYECEFNHTSIIHVFNNHNHQSNNSVCWIIMSVMLCNVAFSQAHLRSDVWLLCYLADAYIQMDSQWTLIKVMKEQISVRQLDYRYANIYFYNNLVVSILAFMGSVSITASDLLINWCYFHKRHLAYTKKLMLRFCLNVMFILIIYKWKPRCK